MSKPDQFEMPLGKYKGWTLDEIASEDEGLKYLDWLIGQEWVRDPLKGNLKEYLEQPAVARELERILED